MSHAIDNIRYIGKAVEWERNRDSNGENITLAVEPLGGTDEQIRCRMSRRASHLEDMPEHVPHELRPYLCQAINEVGEQLLARASELALQDVERLADEEMTRLRMSRQELEGMKAAVAEARMWPGRKTS